MIILCFGQLIGVVVKMVKSRCGVFVFVCIFVLVISSVSAVEVPVIKEIELETILEGDTAIDPAEETGVVIAAVARVREVFNIRETINELVKDAYNNAYNSIRGNIEIYLANRKQAKIDAGEIVEADVAEAGEIREAAPGYPAYNRMNELLKEAQEAAEEAAKAEAAEEVVGDVELEMTESGGEVISTKEVRDLIDNWADEGGSEGDWYMKWEEVRGSGRFDVETIKAKMKYDPADFSAEADVMTELETELEVVEGVGAWGRMRNWFSDLFEAEPSVEAGPWLTEVTQQWELDRVDLQERIKNLKPYEEATEVEIGAGKMAPAEELDEISELKSKLRSMQEDVGPEKFEFPESETELIEETGDPVKFDEPMLEAEMGAEAESGIFSNFYNAVRGRLENLYNRFFRANLGKGDDVEFGEGLSQEEVDVKFREQIGDDPGLDDPGEFEAGEEADEPSDVPRQELKPEEAGYTEAEVADVAKVEEYGVDDPDVEEFYSETEEEEIEVEIDEPEVKMKVEPEVEPEVTADVVAEAKADIIGSGVELSPEDIVRLDELANEWLEDGGSPEQWVEKWNSLESWDMETVEFEMSYNPSDFVKEADVVLNVPESEVELSFEEIKILIDKWIGDGGKKEEWLEKWDGLESYDTATIESEMVYVKEPVSEADVVVEEEAAEAVSPRLRPDVPVRSDPWYFEEIKGPEMEADVVVDATGAEVDGAGVLFDEASYADTMYSSQQNIYKEYLEMIKKRGVSGETLSEEAGGFVVRDVGKTSEEMIARERQLERLDEIWDESDTGIGSESDVEIARWGPADTARVVEQFPEWELDLERVEYYAEEESEMREGSELEEYGLEFEEEDIEEFDVEIDIIQPRGELSPEELGDMYYEWEQDGGNMDQWNQKYEGLESTDRAKVESEMKYDPADFSAESDVVAEAEAGGVARFFGNIRSTFTNWINRGRGNLRNLFDRWFSPKEPEFDVDVKELDFVEIDEVLEEILKKPKVESEVITELEADVGVSGSAVGTDIEMVSIGGQGLDSGDVLNEAIAQKVANNPEYDAEEMLIKMESRMKAKTLQEEAARLEEEEYFASSITKAEDVPSYRNFESMRDSQMKLNKKFDEFYRAQDVAEEAAAKEFAEQKIEADFPDLDEPTFDDFVEMEVMHMSEDVIEAEVKTDVVADVVTEVDVAEASAGSFLESVHSSFKDWSSKGGSPKQWFKHLRKQKAEGGQMTQEAEVWLKQMKEEGRMEQAGIEEELATLEEQAAAKVAQEVEEQAIPKWKVKLSLDFTDSLDTIGEDIGDMLEMEIASEVDALILNPAPYIDSAAGVITSELVDAALESAVSDLAAETIAEEATMLAP